jgi:hypothetical protein
MNKTEWIRFEWDQYQGDKFNIPLFVSYLNVLVETQENVVEPPDLSISAIAVSMPDSDNLLIQNQYNGTYRSILENFAKGAIADVLQDLKNLLASDISTQGKIIIQSVVDLIEAYIASPPTVLRTVFKTRCAIAGFETVYQYEVELCV